MTEENAIYYRKGYQYQYCCQCRERNTQITGCFIHAGDFFAFSPVFNNLVELYQYMDDNNLEVSNNGDPWYCQVKSGNKKKGD